MSYHFPTDKNIPHPKKRHHRYSNQHPFQPFSPKETVGQRNEHTGGSVSDKGHLEQDLKGLKITENGVVDVEEVRLRGEESGEEGAELREEHDGAKEEDGREHQQEALESLPGFRSIVAALPSRNPPGKSQRSFVFGTFPGFSMPRRRSLLLGKKRLGSDRKVGLSASSSRFQKSNWLNKWSDLYR